MVHQISHCIVVRKQSEEIVLKRKAWGTKYGPQGYASVPHPDTHKGALLIPYALLNPVRLAYCNDQSDPEEHLFLWI